MSSNPAFDRTPLPRLVLASSSPYRKLLLERLRLPFVTVAPAIDETQKPDEPPLNLVRRLAETKARALQSIYPEALIIGSDQVAVCGGKILSKPQNFDTAKAQLAQISGRQVEFITGLCLLNAKTGTLQVDAVPYTVSIRYLTLQQIACYLAAEQPFDCVGSFKSEGLGIALFSKLEGEDPTSLVGLPLIRLVRMLQEERIDVLSPGAGG
jgi:septum formation protein